MIIGYARISTPKQNTDRQIRNIKSAYPEAVIVKEIYTGTKISRPEFKNILRRVRSGDTIVFDSVDRMSRDAEEGYKTYEDLYLRGVELVFLKEPHISTSVYRTALNNSIPLTGTAIDYILEGVNRYLLELAREQIRIAFDQAEKEARDLRQRVVEGIETARLNGKPIGRQAGSTVETKKGRSARDVIQKHSRSFGGTLDDVECMKLAGVSKNTYYKYKRQIRDETMLALNS